MPFALDVSPTSQEMAEAINYLLANFGPNLSADPNTGQIAGPQGIVVGYLYRYMSIKYSDSLDGSLNFSNVPTNRLYYGIRNSDDSTESTNPADYIWFKVAGGGFSTTKFLFYQTTGGRAIQFVVSTTKPANGWAQDSGTAIDLDIITAVLLTAAATPTIYQWTGSSTPPARPTTTTTYTWSTASYTAPSGWAVTPPSNTSPGAYLWAITIPIVADSTTTTTTLDWTNVSYAIRSISYNGTDGAAGPNGLNAITAYLQLNQASGTPGGFPQTTVGSTAPSGWSLTAPSVSVGNVLWYSQGQFNNSSTTINGIAPNTTYWNNPVAASIFQDIRSDNWNGSTPPTYGVPSTYGTAGYYIQRNTGDVYFNDGVFRADIQTDGDAVFEGKTATTFQANIGGSNYYIDYSSLSNGLTSATSGYVRGGVVGYAYSTTSAWNVGVIGVGRNNGSTSGIGIVGQGDLIGGYFSSSNAGGATVQCNNLAGGPALQIVSAGSFVWNSYNIPAPSGSSSTFLRNDGTWASASGLTTGTANSGTATVSGGNMNFLGSVSTGIAGAYVGVTGSGSTLTWGVQTTSPSDVRLKEDIQDTDVGLAFVKQLRPVSYRLKADPNHQKGYGFIAQEVEQLVGSETSLVYEEPNWQVGDEVGFKTIHYPSYIAVLTKAIQELTAKVEALESQLQSPK